MLTDVKYMGLDRLPLFAPMITREIVLNKTWWSGWQIFGGKRRLDKNKIYLNKYRETCSAYEPFRSTRLYICRDDVSTCFLTPLATLLSVFPIRRHEPAAGHEPSTTTTTTTTTYPHGRRSAKRTSNDRYDFTVTSSTSLRDPVGPTRVRRLLYAVSCRNRVDDTAVRRTLYLHHRRPSTPRRRRVPIFRYGARYRTAR